MRSNKDPLFHTVELETNTLCNRRCVYCPNIKYTRGDYFMNEDLFKKIVDDLSSMGYNGRIRPHFYGEPLLDKRLPKLVRYTRKKLPKANIQIFTNGDFLSNKFFIQLLKEGVDKFIVTTHDSESDNKIMMLINSLNSKDKKRIHYQKNDEIYMMNRGGLLNIEPVRAHCCNYPSNYLIINFKGEVILCCNDYFCKYVFGDLKKEKILDVWNKPELKKVREELQNGIFRQDICKKCTENV